VRPGAGGPAADPKLAICEKAHIPVCRRSLCCAALRFWSPGTPKGAGGLGTRPQRGGAVAFQLMEMAEPRWKSACENQTQAALRASEPVAGGDRATSAN